MNKDETLHNLLIDVSEAHHQAYVIEHGEDPNWAIWCANHLLDSADFKSMFGNDISSAQLIYCLMALRIDEQSSHHEAEWSVFYVKNMAKYLEKAAR